MGLWLKLVGLVKRLAAIWRLPAIAELLVVLVLVFVNETFTFSLTTIFVFVNWKNPAVELVRELTYSRQ